MVIAASLRSCVYSWIISTQTSESQTCVASVDAAAMQASFVGLHDLPSAILRDILGQVSLLDKLTCEQVCKSWRQAVQKPPNLGCFVRHTVVSTSQRQYRPTRDCQGQHRHTRRVSPGVQAPPADGLGAQSAVRAVISVQFRSLASSPLASPDTSHHYRQLSRHGLSP